MLRVISANLQKLSGLITLSKFETLSKLFEGLHLCSKVKAQTAGLCFSYLLYKIYFFFAAVPVFAVAVFLAAAVFFGAAAFLAAGFFFSANAFGS